MWKKYTPPKVGSNGRLVRTVPAVFRGRTGRKAAVLVLPDQMATAERCDIYENGHRFLAFQQHDDGFFSVISASSGGKVKHVTVPAKYAHRIPYGTTDVTLTRDGDMLVLDLDQLPRPAADMAAE